MAKACNEQRSFPSITPTRVLIADDHPVVRQGLRALLSSEPDLEIVGEADNGTKAVQLAGELAPDVVLMDVAMPHCSGIAATQRILQNNPQCKIVALSSYGDEESVHGMLQAGAAAYLTKRSAVGGLTKAIRDVRAGGRCLNQSIIPTAQQLKTLPAATLALKIKPLTEIERRLIGLLAEGLSNKDVASRMDIECSQVKYYRERVMSKLNLHSVAELTRYAISNGLTTCRSEFSIEIRYRMSTSGMSDIGFASNKFDRPATICRLAEPKRDDLAEIRRGIVEKFCSTKGQRNIGVQGHTTKPETTTHSTEITQRESEVLNGIAHGLTNKAIAARLRIGIRTVETHREKVMRKLGIRSIAGLTKFVLASEENPVI